MKRIHLIIFGIICTVMLILSSYSNRNFTTLWSDGYYRLLRIVVCLVAGLFAYIAYKTKRQWILWPCVAMIIFYNPLLTIELSSESCEIVDFLCGVFFLVPAFVLRIPDELKPPESAKK